MVTFQTLWNNHPTTKGDAALLDVKAYPNQCAVRMHAWLERSGFDLKTFRGLRSWQKGKPGYALRAQELADWLASPFSKLPPVEKYRGQEVFQKIGAKTGIIFFQNYWGPGNQGDHVDLYNGSRLTDWRSWVRLRFRIVIPGVWEDLEKAQGVWFRHIL